MGYRCEREGVDKVVRDDPDGSVVSKLYCKGHARDWQRQFGGRIVSPRRVPGLSDDPIQCYGDWLLPGEVPG